VTALQYGLLAATLAVCLLVTAVSAAAQVASSLSGRSQLRQILEPGQVTGLRGSEGLVRIGMSLLVLNGLGLLASAVILTLLVRELSQPWQVIAMLGGGCLVLALFHVAPRIRAAGNPDRAARLLAGPVRVLILAVSPLVWLTARAAELTAGLGGPVSQARLTTDEELQLLVDVGEEQGLIEEEEREMITGIIELGKTAAREVMVPRIDIHTVAVGATLGEAVEVIIECGHSRIPAYDETIDHVAGILYAKDLLRAMHHGSELPTIEPLLRPAYFIPEFKPIDDLLAELQHKKVHMAIVVDEYGGTAGLVTIEDLIEEIVGEIQDEYDTEEPRYERITDDEFEFSARVDLDDVNRLMEISLPTNGADTLAGLVYSQLGRVPDVGDSARFDDARIDVLSVDGRRIEKVLVVRERGSVDSGPGAADPPADGGGAA
jgi:CBS domain containing-hemolysin-like protein